VRLCDILPVEEVRDLVRVCVACAGAQLVERSFERGELGTRDFEELQSDMGVRGIGFTLRNAASFEHPPSSPPFRQQASPTSRSRAIFCCPR
jgi:hypothetical protein